MSLSWHYQRPELAKAICDQLTSGLFTRIAYLGARRIGKTMFVLKDLIPVLADNRCFPIYISMWGNKHAPHKEIINKLGLALQSAQQKSSIHAVLDSEVTKLSIAGVALEFGKVEPVTAPDDDLVTIGNLLRELVAIKQDKRIVLLIDEVQHLITAKEFESLQYSLRTIFDELNEQISVLYTGSSRKGMAAMFNNSDMPFYHSANQVAFPVLPETYVEHMTSMLKQHFHLSYDVNQLKTFFAQINQSAFWFDKLIRVLALEQCPLSKGIEQIKAQIKEAANYDSIIDSLSILQMCVLVRVSEELSRYDRAAQDYYQGNGAASYTRGQIQSAFNSLINKRLVTRVNEVIFVEESSIADAIKQRLTALK